MARKSPPVPLWALLTWFKDMNHVRETVKDRGIELEHYYADISWADASKLLRERLRWRRRGLDGYKYNREKYKDDVDYALERVRDDANRHIEEQQARKAAQASKDEESKA